MHDRIIPLSTALVTPTIFMGFAPSRGYSIKVPVRPNSEETQPRAVVKVKSASWGKLGQAIVEQPPKLVEEKRKLSYAVWGTFNNTFVHNNITHAFRINGNIANISCIWLDLDKPNTNNDFDTLHELLNMSGAPFALYTTHSYDPNVAEKRYKFRILVPLDTPIAKSDLNAAVFGLASCLELQYGEFDLVSTVPSQPMYLPGAPVGRSHLIRRVGRFGRGRAHFASGAALIERGNAFILELTERGALDGSRGGSGRRQGVSAFLARAPEDIDVGDRHAYLKGVMRREAGRGRDQGSAALTLREFNARFSSPLSEDELNGLIDRVWRAFTEGDVAFGYSELVAQAEQVGEDLHEPNIAARRAALHDWLDLVKRAVRENVLKAGPEEQALYSSLPIAIKRIYPATRFRVEMANERRSALRQESQSVVNSELLQDFGDLMLNTPVQLSFNGGMGGSGSGSELDVLGAEFEDTNLLRDIPLREQFNLELRTALQRYVYILSETRVFDSETKLSYPKEDFQHILARVQRNVARTSAQFELLFPDTAGVPPRAYALENELLTTVDHRGVYPGKPRLALNAFGIPFFNTYQEPVWASYSVDMETAERRIKPFIAHVKYLIPNEQDREIYWNVMSWLVQRPHKRLRWVYVLTGGHGTGKSFALTDLLVRLLGSTNVDYVDQAFLEGRSPYNDSLFKAQVVCLPEVDMSRQANAKVVLNTLKEPITGSIAAVTEKFVRRTTRENMTSYIGFANHPTPIPHELNDRRWYVAKGAWSRPRRSVSKNVEYFDFLWNTWLADDRNIAGLYSWLAIRELPNNFDTICPVREKVLGKDDVLALDDDYEDDESNSSEGTTWLERAVYLICNHPDTPFARTDEDDEGDADGVIEQLFSYNGGEDANTIYWIDQKTLLWLLRQIGATFTAKSWEQEEVHKLGQPGQSLSLEEFKALMSAQYWRRVDHKNFAGDKRIKNIWFPGGRTAFSTTELDKDTASAMNKALLDVFLAKLGADLDTPDDLL